MNVMYMYMCMQVAKILYIKTLCMYIKCIGYMSPMYKNALHVHRYQVFMSTCPTCTYLHICVCREHVSYALYVHAQCKILCSMHMYMCIHVCQYIARIWASGCKPTQLYNWRGCDICIYLYMCPIITPAYKIIHDVSNLGPTRYVQTWSQLIESSKVTHKEHFVIVMAL